MMTRNWLIEGLQYARRRTTESGKMWRKKKNEFFTFYPVMYYLLSFCLPMKIRYYINTPTFCSFLSPHMLLHRGSDWVARLIATYGSTAHRDFQVAVYNDLKL